MNLNTVTQLLLKLSDPDVSSTLFIIIMPIVGGIVKDISNNMTKHKSSRSFLFRKIIIGTIPAILISFIFRDKVPNLNPIYYTTFAFLMGTIGYELFFFISKLQNLLMLFGVVLRVQGNLSNSDGLEKMADEISTLATKKKEQEESIESEEQKDETDNDTS